MLTLVGLVRVAPCALETAKPFIVSLNVMFTLFTRTGETPFERGTEIDMPFSIVEPATDDFRGYGRVF